jgi:CheY-like chemotaxis protein/signal transduction histidine kinase
MRKHDELEKQIVELEKKLKEQIAKNNYLEKLVSASSLRGESGAPHLQRDLAKSKLWSHISHELLTPMDGILGMTELAMDTELTDEQRNYLEMINASADRLFGVVGDIIDYSELMEGNLRYDLKNFDLFEELEYDLYIAKLSAKHKDLKFSATFAKDIPGYLNTDPDRLLQVFNTLVGNAIHFTEEGEVRVAVDKNGYDDQGRLLLKFTVKDTGQFIPVEVQHSIFETPIPVGISGGLDKYSEGGLGLVVAAKLVELFGGEIGVTSSKNGGSTFWFTWPVANPVEMYMGELPADMFSERLDRSMVLRGAKVLLAEDEFINASITKAFLEQVGVDVDVVNDGNEAVRAMESKDYQAVLMDVQMPVMDGIDATIKIRKKERRKGRRCPIIALTAHALRGDRERCLQAGMDDYLAKPLDRNQLIEMLARYITKKALVVSSDPASQHQILQPLVHNGWGVVIAETGRMARYEASLAHFDMIVIDASVPLKDGLETVQTIRQLEKFSGCRAIILGTGFSTKGECQEYVASGVDEFCPQPDMVSDFVRRVEELC